MLPLDQVLLVLLGELLLLISIVVATGRVPTVPSRRSCVALVGTSTGRVAAANAAARVASHRIVRLVQQRHDSTLAVVVYLSNRERLPKARVTYKLNFFDIAVRTVGLVRSD